jgi:hypothetical protein
LNGRGQRLAWGEASARQLLRQYANNNKQDVNNNHANNDNNNNADGNDQKRDGKNYKPDGNNHNPDSNSNKPDRNNYKPDGKPPLDVAGPRHAMMVFAADVVYDENQFPPLVACLAALCGPHTLVLLGYRQRTEKKTVRK